MEAVALTRFVRMEQTAEAIARDAGYQNPFVFSNAFRKWIAWRP